MFRKPRSPSQQTADVGRAPSPTRGPDKTPFSLAVPPTVPPPTMPTKIAAKSKPGPLPTIGRQGPSSSVKKAAPVVKGKFKPNGNILSFFKKEETGLFVEDGTLAALGNGAEEEAMDIEGHEEAERYHEYETPSKRRRLSGKREGSGEVQDESEVAPPEQDAARRESAAVISAPKSGPFMEASDSEDDDDERPEAVLNFDARADGGPMNILAAPEAVAASNVPQPSHPVPGEEPPDPEAHSPPALIKQETSYGTGLEDFKDFEGLEDEFDEDLFEEGDEFMERRYMEEQARLEAEENEKDYDPVSPEDENVPTENAGESGGGPSCPICSLSLAGAKEQDASQHVNNCLDGNPTPLPASKPEPSPPAQIKTENITTAAQFKRPVRPPKPGQQNPFALGQPTNGASGGSAFSKLMSGHTEEQAWAEAAASENASRGKPAYQRTCPFYKILPGLAICVDAFRYGAVSGCQGYFLSHFHSDHYIGLTSSWSHGPIYCSHVTANLVRQQLRVDPKWVVDLEFDQEFIVPSTNGVKVTMIPANHCPGSSLYLFEKSIGKQKSGEPKLQRILHCGDFRACRAHVEHPLLMPDIQDKLTGKTREQKIDVCYLDTTYLNPKYAFPSQTSVITACADMCVSLSKCTPDASDGWEQMKRQRAGEGMAKFIQRENSIKEEPAEDGTGDDAKLERQPNASQQIISSTNGQKTRGRLLVVVGTYSIGKERICLGIARALKSKIYAPPGKMKIIRALEDPEIDALMTTNPCEAQVHMTPLFEIRADTLDDYLKDYFPHFTRAVGFRPSGWSYKPPTSRFTASPSVQNILHSDSWKSVFAMKDLVPQRGSTGRASCFGVPYSEHSSFRELTVFCCALRIEKIIPTVNVGSAKGRERMKGWCERWAMERKKTGVYELPEDGGF